MLKQLLIFIQIIIFTYAICTLDTSIDDLKTYSAVILNDNLAAKVKDFTIPSVHTNTSSYSLAIQGIEIDQLTEWSLIFRQINRNSIIIRFKNDLVSWLKISCIVLASRRQDLTLGFTFLNRIRVNANKTAYTEIALNRNINSHETSIAFAFINGLKFVDNMSKILQIKTSEIKQRSIIFSISVDQSIGIENLYFSYIVFSPLTAKFQSVGNYLDVEASKEERYIDLSQSLFYQGLSFYGFTGLISQQKDLRFSFTIDEDLVLSSLSKHKTVNIQYILILPQLFDCQKCNQTFLFKSKCLQTCPNTTILYTQNERNYCKPCSSKLNLAIFNETCVCKQGYTINQDNACVPLALQLKNQGQSDILSKNQTKKEEKVSDKPVEEDKMCENISNSLFVNNRCSCMVGYVNFSNNCVPLVSLGLTIMNSSNIVSTNTHVSLKSEGNACKVNEQYSLSLKRCKCLSGFALNNASICLNICKASERYDDKLDRCVCSSGEGRINGQCIVCSRNNELIGNETCYHNIKDDYCLNNYYFFDKFCYSCPSIKESVTINGVCMVCSNGLIYNGSSCVCLAGNKVINGVCIGQNCGDSKINLAIESCDDGNTINGDGCSSQCIIQQRYYCVNQPSSCGLNICGNGIITGAQECDDNNTNNKDGCSSLCLVQSSSTCLETPSVCFPMKSGNVSLLSMHSNGVNAFFMFQIPFTINNLRPLEIQQFFRQQALKDKINSSIYSQQDPRNPNRFNVLVIFINGMPDKKTFFSFSYSYRNLTGNIIIPIVIKQEQLNSRQTRQRG